ncbi:FlgD immunoglobulin-like domain containing protein [Candidatus Eisenbacteria bacterium]|uniref:FlgD immunoglobulin-like domain containing protein n=1 Tax=Eiseniibacteriota bacterium TaxID=2212470 RepID=A0ABV6YK74_UNCEI
MGDTLDSNQGDGGITIWGSNTNIRDCVISNNQHAGIQVGRIQPRGMHDSPGRAAEQMMWDGTRADSVVVEDCILQGNEHGLATVSSTMHVRMTDNEITGHNSGFGVINYVLLVFVDARYNWWGDPTGPGGVGPGNGDAVSEGVQYYPWRPGGAAIAESSRGLATAWNNARKIVRDECPPSYKVVYPHEQGIFITMSNHPETGEWSEPFDVWPVEMIHVSTDPAIAIAGPQPEGWCDRYPLVHLVWSEHVSDSTHPGEILYTFSEDGGFTWEPPENISNTATPSEHPSIAVDGHGIVHVVWEEWETFAPDVIYANNGVDGWTVPENISQTPQESMFPTVAANYQYNYPPSPPWEPDDRIHIAWTEFEPHPQGLVTPWIAYRSYDFWYWWLPPLDQPAEDVTAGTGGAFASIIAYPTQLEIGRVPGVAWHWPFDPEEPPSAGSDILYNDRRSGAWGTPRTVHAPSPIDSPSRFVSLALQAGEFPDTLWAVWEEWNIDAGDSEIFSAYSPDLGATWFSYLNLSQTPYQRSLHPGLAYHKATTFDGLYDVCWMETSGDVQPVSEVYYLSTTSLDSEIAASAPLEDQAPGDRLSVSCAPAPFSDEVRFSIAVPSASTIELRVCDVQGRLVRSIRERADNAGTVELAWDGRGSRGEHLPAGVYFADVCTASRSESKRIVLIR